MPNLTALQQALIREILKTPDLATAMRAANPGRYKNDNAAAACACRMLKRPEVAAALEAARSRVQEKAELTAARVLKRLEAIGFADPRKFFNPDGTVKSVRDMDEETAAALAGFDVTTKPGKDGEPPTITIKPRLRDAIAALGLIGKHFGMFAEKPEPPPPPPPAPTSITVNGDITIERVDKVHADLMEIFGDAAATATANAKGGGDPVLSPKPRAGSGKERGASARGKKVARKK